jgi:membrane protein DedA with SNARE-associated domain/rhodanese-related sulfurtransferase
METLLYIIETYGLWVVFICVLMDQGGLPVPAYPPLIVTAAYEAQSGQSIVPVLLVATLAAILADLLWYAFGRRFGASMLRLMCKVSLSPDSCVGTTRRIYAKWGSPSLIFAKYIPGFAAVATTLAGETRTNLVRFLIFDGIGAALWAAGAVVLGVLFHEAIEAVLLELERLGYYAGVLLLGAVALFVASKWWQRKRFLMQIQMARLSAAELNALLDAQGKVTILDVRAPERRRATGWIPGSIHVENIETLQLDPGDEVVVYCDCPNDASAAVIARKLQEKGFTRVRPLAGGLDAWRRQGGRVDLEEIWSGANASREHSAQAS